MQRFPVPFVEAPVLQEFSVNYPDVQFAGILTRDNLSSAKAFYENYNLTYPTFKDDSLILVTLVPLPGMEHTKMPRH